jgi:hypothetical protein
VRESGFELTNGETLIAALPKVDGEYDWATLTQLAQQLKQENPDVDDASVLMERTVKYDYLIQVMDAIRSAETPASGESAADFPATPQKTELFTNIAVGEAP